MIIDKLGPRFGLTACLALACVGSAISCLIGYNLYAYIFGYFITVVAVQGVHAAKGVFVNLYFDEKAVI